MTLLEACAVGRSFFAEHVGTALGFPQRSLMTILNAPRAIVGRGSGEQRGRDHETECVADEVGSGAGCAPPSPCLTTWFADWGRAG